MRNFACCLTALVATQIANAIWSFDTIGRFLLTLTGALVLMGIVGTFPHRQE